MDIALIEPEIPGNTGSIGRLCVGTETGLHLVGRLGFDISDKAVRRAGLDYWKHVDLHVHPDVEQWFDVVAGRRLLMFSTHGTLRYDKVDYRPTDVLVFGCETRGLAPAVRARATGPLLRLPVTPMIRSLNLANAASIALFEALRQQGFADIDAPDGQS